MYARRLHPADRPYAVFVAGAMLALFALGIILWPYAAFAEVAYVVPPPAAPAPAGLPGWMTVLVGVLMPALGAVLTWLGVQLGAAVRGWLEAKTAAAAALASSAGTDSVKAKWELELLKFGALLDHFLEAHLGELKDDLVVALADGNLDDAERAALITKWKGIVVDQGGSGALAWLKAELGTAFELFVQGGVERSLQRVLSDGTAKTATVVPPPPAPEARPTAPVPSPT